MFCQRLRKFVFAGALLALAPFMARAEDAKKAEPIAAPHAHGTPAITASSTGACAPAMVKVRVCEKVPEVREVVKTTYRQECREEAYTAYRYETVNEQKTRQVTTYKRVCETVMENRTTCVKVPCVETRTEYKTTWKRESYTEMKTKCVDKGHWECKEVPVGPSIFDRLSHKGKGDCCDPCPQTCRTKTVRCWVPCMVTECVPVCKTRLVKHCEPCTKQVCTYKTEHRTECVPVQKWKCVPECKTETYTECKKVCVPYQAKRNVNVCVPVQEKCNVTVWVEKWTEKEVPCAAPSACNPCDNASACCGGGAGFFSKLRDRASSWGKKSDCCDAAPSCCK